MPAVMMGSSFSGVQGWYGRQQTRELDWRCQAPLVQLMIQLLSGGTILVEAEAGDSIETLKGIIRRREAEALAFGVPGHVGGEPADGPAPLLALGTQLLPDERTVAQCGLRRLTVLRQLPPPPEPEPEPEPELEPEPEPQEQEPEPQEQEASRVRDDSGPTLEQWLGASLHATLAPYLVDVLGVEEVEDMLYIEREQLETLRGMLKRVPQNKFDVKLRVLMRAEQAAAYGSGSESDGTGASESEPESGRRSRSRSRSSSSRSAGSRSRYSYEYASGSDSDSDEYRQTSQRSRNRTRTRSDPQHESSRSAGRHTSHRSPDMTWSGPHRSFPASSPGTARSSYLVPSESHSARLRRRERLQQSTFGAHLAGEYDLGPQTDVGSRRPKSVAGCARSSLGTARYSPEYTTYRDPGWAEAEDTRRYYYARHRRTPRSRRSRNRAAEGRDPAEEICAVVCQSA